VRSPRNWSITPNPGPRKMHVKKFSDNAMHHLAGIPHLADDLPTEVTDTTVAYPGRSSLSLFCKERRPQKTSEHDKAHQTFTFALSLSISRMA
jgi:hypothetical protein